MSTAETRKVIIVPNQESFTPAEIRKLLGVSRNTVYYWLDKKKLASRPRFFWGGRVVSRDDLIGFIQVYLDVVISAPQEED